MAVAAVKCTCCYGNLCIKKFKTCKLYQVQVLSTSAKHFVRYGQMSFSHVLPFHNHKNFLFKFFISIKFSDAIVNQKKIKILEFSPQQTFLFIPFQCQNFLLDGNFPLIVDSMFFIFTRFNARLSVG